MKNPKNNPEAQAVQVVEVWNHWVRVRFPESGELCWIDLREHGWEKASAPRTGTKGR